MFMLIYKDSCKDRQPSSTYTLGAAVNGEVMKAPTLAKNKLDERGPSSHIQSYGLGCSLLVKFSLLKTMTHDHNYAHE